MGLSLRKLFKAREKPEEDVQRVSSVEIADQQVRDAVTEICLRELAFWTCVGKIANALTKCEFRTFYEGEELFKDEYYLWNYEPNRNQNKAEFLSKAMEQLFRNNELLIVESYDGQLLVADDFSVTKNALYGDTYTNVQVDDYTFSRSFRSSDVLHWTLNNKNVNRIMQHLYDSYSKLIDYSAKSYLKSRGSRGTLNISAMAQSDKLFNEKLEKLMNEYFKSFFESPNAVLPLFEGYSYTDIGSKTYSEGTSRDIKSQYDDIFDFTARGFSMPPTLAKGDVQDTEKAVDEMLTFCLDPLAQMFMQEINRKRIGKNGIQKGTKLQIDTMRVKHIDMFDIATSADKLISSGIYTVNMILRALGEIPIDEDWADQHFITKNYSTIQEILEEQQKGGLVYDTYIVSEKKAPEGLTPVGDFEITIEEDAKTLYYILENKKIFSPVKLVKKDSETEKIIPVAGAVFRLLDKDKKPITMTTHYPNESVYDLFKTDENGSFVLPEKLPAGRRWKRRKVIL